MRHRYDWLKVAFLLGLAHAVSARTAEAADPPTQAEKERKLDQLTFCMQSAASARKLFIAELQKGCLSGAKVSKADVSVCQELGGAGSTGGTGSTTSASSASSTGAGGPECVTPQPIPAFACTTCTPGPVAECSTKTIVSGSMTFAKSKDGEALITTDEGTSFLIQGSYGGKLTTAALAFQIKSEGHDGPYDIVTAVIDAGFNYTESTVSTGAVTVNGRRYYSAESFACSHTTKGDRWVLTTHVDRDCTSPVNQKPTPQPKPAKDE